MKKLLLLPLLVAIISCQPKPEQAAPEPKKVDPALQAEFDAVDAKISQLLDKLDDPNTPQAERVEIVCKTYPDVYNNEYLPTFLKFDTDQTEKSMLDDLDFVLDYYKKTFNIQC